ncbi:FERM, ARHGEF and pleckstrin domain-containing protein 2 isoform X2 [Tamandua tetradactyla]|uniref:FERM, ARHGEF and pleckstrin domain-containing protein 2 isoform X2 n=1 Tax=Tamandua tetradactyla TaxID=48850 RepID=UPI0040542140
MGEMEGTYRVLHTPGIRSGAQSPGQALELGQHLPAVPAQRVAGVQEKRLPIRVQLLDGTVELFDIEMLTLSGKLLQLKMDSGKTKVILYTNPWTTRQEKQIPRWRFEEVRTPLRGHLISFSPKPKCNGQELLTQLWQRLNVIESDYFGLEFQNVQSYWVWLEPMKPIIKQVRRPKNAVLRLAVKFFPPDPGQLQEEYTRYLFALQLKRDLLEERLTCNETTAALLAAHLLQSEIGDYDEVLDREHLQAHKYLPGQGHALEKILEFHRKHMGQTPAESDFQVLEIARKLEMYGIRFHLASDREGTKIHLAVSHMGVLVFQGTTKINTFNWSKVRKLSFKRKRFLIKLHPEVHGPYQDTLEFLLGSRDECKNFWKICVEYHTFFRIFDQPKPKAKAVFFSRGSSFRYSGRTQKQLVDYVKDSGMKKIPYERRHSKTRASLRALSADLPKQSISFTEGMRTWASPFSANASFCSAPASPVAPSRLDLKNSSSSLPDPQAPTIRSPAAERSPGNMAMASGTSTGVQPCQGLAVECPLSPPSPRMQSPSLKPPLRAALSPEPSPLLSPALSDAGGAQTPNPDEEDVEHQLCTPTDKVYFIAKELLATERTHLKDLEVITVWFRSTAIKTDAAPDALTGLLLASFDPFHEFHRRFLCDLEQGLALWEGPWDASPPRLGDILLGNMQRLQEFSSCFQGHEEVLTELGKGPRRCGRLDAVSREFELQKVCYLPLSSFLLKPAQRLGQYQRLLTQLCQHLAPGHPEHPSYHGALAAVVAVVSELRPHLTRLETLQKLVELQRALVGVENLAAPGREFVREGCLHKLTKKGLQQRMFFLFSDVLLYTSRGSVGSSCFRIRSLLPLRGMLVEETENNWSVPHCFTICSAQKTVVVAASRLEMEKWTSDLSTAIEVAKTSCSPSPAHIVWCPEEAPLEQGPGEDTRSMREGPGQQRITTTLHMCWYRNTSISQADHSAAVENQLSGYLLRKFKNSNGWQKLWVVFTNFCLFFYKTHQDDYPLASLPLLGYSVSVPREADGIHKDLVFKLQFKSHVYFFRAESKYTFERWMEVIEGASSSPGS